MKKEKKKEEQYINSPLNNPMLNYDVYVPGKGERIVVSILFFLIGGCVGMVFYGNLFMRDGMATTATYISNLVFFVIVGVLAVRFAFPVYIKNCLEKRKNKLKLQFRASFSSGSNVQNAFQAAYEDLNMQYEKKDYIVVEMQEILNGIAQNINIEDMMRNFGDRSGNEDIRSFADVFEVCYRKGGDMKVIIHRTHNIISEKMAVADEIETKLTSNKMQHNVMSIMPVAVVMLLRVTNEAFAANFATPMGVFVNTIVIGIFVGAYKYGLKIVDIKG